MPDFILRVQMYGADEAENFSEKALKTCLKCGKPMLNVWEYAENGIRELYSCEDQNCNTFYEFIYGLREDEETNRTTSPE